MGVINNLKSNIMKTTIKKVLLVLAVAFTGLVSASSYVNQGDVDPQALAQEIGALLKKPEFKIADDVLTEVTFVFNKENEMVVLTVDTDSEQLRNYIKSRLNYKKLFSKEIKSNQIYKVPVRLIAK